MVLTKVNLITGLEKPLIQVRQKGYRIRVMVPFSVTSLLSLV